MFGLDYTQCGCPKNGLGLNISAGSNPYTPIPDHAINVVSITFCGALFQIDMFFLTVGEFIYWLNFEFVEVHALEGYFFMNQYHELMYSNEEDFCDGSIDLLNLSNIVLSTELSSQNETLPGFQPLASELLGYYFIPENV